MCLHQGLLGHQVLLSCHVLLGEQGLMIGKEFVELIVLSRMVY